MAKILLLEDDSRLSLMIESCLESDRHVVDRASTGAEAFSLLRLNEYDLLVLDWNLPDISGLDVCNRHRAEGGKSAVLMLTAKHSNQDKVLALDSGADDYLTKPFDPSELLARIRALLRRPKAINSDEISHAGLKLNTMTLQVQVGDSVEQLSVKESAVLELMMRNPYKSFSTDLIINKLWKSDSEVSADTVRSHIRNLRRKLKDDQGQVIKQIRGLGYSFHPPENKD